MFVQLEWPPPPKNYALRHYSHVLSCGPVLLAGISSVREVTLPTLIRLFTWESEAPNSFFLVCI